jgi:type II secretory pathway pseudopilin PulG
MSKFSAQQGFTIPEVIIAGVILIILCMGIMTAYSTVTVLNQGNNVRAQALTVLQREVEEFRSFRYVPGTTDARLVAGAYPNYKVGALSVNNTAFNILVTVDNDPSNSVGTNLDAISEADCRFKQITIEAVVQNPSPAWLADIKTKVEIQRVRSN